jgi:hypothetical protein
MSILFNRTAIIPVWIVVFGLLALFWSPLTTTTGVLLLIGAVVAPAIMLVVWKERSPTVAEVLHDVETTRSTDRTPAPDKRLRR